MRVATALGTTADTLDRRADRGEVVREALARRERRELRHVVRRRERSRAQAGHRHRVHDVAGSLPPRSCGARTPGSRCRIPQRLTPSVHSKSLGGRSQIRPPANTPALLQSTSTVTERRERVVGEREHVLEARHVGRQRRDRVRGDRGLDERVLLDVGRDDAHAFRGERVHEGAPDPAAGAGDHHDLAVECSMPGMRGRGHDACEDALVCENLTTSSRAHPRREGGAGRRRRPVAHRRRRAAGHPAAEGDRRAERRARRAVVGRPFRRLSRAAPRSARRGTPSSSTRSGSRLGDRDRAQARARAACADGQHPPAPARGSQLRVLLRGSVPVRARWRSRTSPACSRTGVGCSVKHFVANDSEFERMTISSEVDERTLREISLVPFEAAVLEARHVGGDVGVQPRQRHVLQRAPVAARRVLQRRVGLRRRRDVGLVRHAQHRGRGERRARPRDARAAAVVRRTSSPTRCARVTSTRSASTTRCAAC